MTPIVLAMRNGGFYQAVVTAAPIDRRWAAIALPECGFELGFQPEDHGDP